MNIGNWMLKKLLGNFGEVTPNLHRSGQPYIIGLYFHYWLFPFTAVLNLAWSPETDRDDPREREFCNKRGIDYYGFQWGAGGPSIDAIWDIETTVALLSKLLESGKKVWVHCEGGKDRTGGLIARWKQFYGYSMENIFEDFENHKVPAWRWIEYLFIRKDF